MTFRMYFFGLFTSMLACTTMAEFIAGDTAEWTDAIESYEIKDNTPPPGDAKPDAPLLTRDVRLMPDEEASEEGPPVVIGVYDAEGVTLRYEKGSIILEGPIGLRGSQDKDPTFDAVSTKVSGRKSERSGMGDGDDDGGYAPKHLASHPSMPTKEKSQQRHVFGSDQRRVYRDTSFPYSTVGRVSPSGCTGTMIGPRHVLTAAHCMSPGSQSFTPVYYNGAAPFGTASVTNVLHWDVVDLSDGFTNFEVAFDYAVLILSSPMGDTTGWVGFRTYSSSWNGGRYWDNFGYPGGLTNNQRPTYTLDGSIESAEQQTFKTDLEGLVLGHFIDIEGGHSGGPFWGWFGEENFPRIVAVQSSESRTPAFNTAGDNQAAGGQALTDLLEYARANY